MLQRVVEDRAARYALRLRSDLMGPYRRCDILHTQKEFEDYFRDFLQRLSIPSLRL